MRLRTRTHPLSGSRGFSLTEMVVVVGLIVIVLAIALPNIAGYVRNAKVRGATQEVAGEIQTARNRAIKKNVSPGPTGGVVFAILDANSYRFTVLDENDWIPPVNDTLGLAPVRSLPAGLEFLPGASGPVFGMGFDSLGQRCVLGGTSPCSPVQTQVSMCGDGNPNCDDRPAGDYIDSDPTDPTTLRIRIREISTGVVRTVSVQSGGKVQAQK